jgi:hypothetical protein
MLSIPKHFPFSAAALLFFLLACDLPTWAQFVKIEAGASDMVPTQGGAISFQGPNYESYLGAGELNGAFRLGSYLKTSIGPYQVALGDQSIKFGLPTDILGGNQYFLTRGAGATLPVGNSRLFFFGGATTLSAGSPLFQAFQIETPLGMLFFERPLSEKLRFYSRNVFSNRQSFIQGFDWRPRPWFKTAISGGTGSNKPYIAAAADIDGNWFTLQTAFIGASDRFRRITTPTLFAAEPDRENILATVKPYSSLVLTAGHQNFLAPQGNNLNAPLLRAGVDQLQSSFDVAQFHLGAGIFASRGPLGHNVSDGFTIARQIGRSVEASTSYYQNLSGPSLHTRNLVGMVRETVSPKISLLQVVNRIQGNTNFLFGGSYTTNRLAAGVDYQTVYMPFLKNPLVTGVGVSLKLKLWGDFQLHGQTFRSPDGRLRYTATLSTLVVAGARGRGASVGDFKMPAYVVHGHVWDESGAPIAGAALRVGAELVYTNAAGEFMAREKHAGSVPLEVVLQQFINPLPFTVVSAPRTVLLAPEGSAPDIQIVLHFVQGKKKTELLPPPRNSAPGPGGQSTQGRAVRSRLLL